MDLLVGRSSFPRNSTLQVWGPPSRCHTSCRPSLLRTSAESGRVRLVCGSWGCRCTRGCVYRQQTRIVCRPANVICAGIRKPSAAAVHSQTFGEYKVTEVESRSQHGSSNAKLCLDFETLALRVEPPSIFVEPGEDTTIVTVDSANMPGILVEVGRVPRFVPLHR